tara:strand:- start:4165 stop:4551 length:387 start_codon:yes stop_codon:yes gene_type:complete
MIMTSIPVPVSILKKIASFVEAVPEVVNAATGAAKQASDNDIKQASDCVAGLIDHAGLLEEKKDSFRDFICTKEGAFKTINSLTQKIASLAEELEDSKQINLGSPSTKKAHSSDMSESARVWCETLLN